MVKYPYFYQRVIDLIYRSIQMQKQIKVIVEKHLDGYFAYPVGLKGVVVAQGDSYDEVLREIQSAIDFHIETFGKEVFEGEDIALDVFIAETQIVM
jgi:predicted RNase H-like HicB family nuclease